MQDKLSEKISVNDIAKRANCSNVYLRLAFRTLTGEGVLPSLLRMRVERAKELLRETQLNVSEIGDTVGMGNPAYFARAFLKRTGVSPSAFRRNAQLGSGPLSQSQKALAKPKDRVWHRDALDNGSPQNGWRLASGNWHQKPGYLEGNTISGMHVLLRKPLPENFRLQFEAQFVPHRELVPSDLLVSLCNENGRSYCMFCIGTRDNTVGELRRGAWVGHWNTDAIIEPMAWHRVLLELRDDTALLHMDGKRLFLFQDPFPPPYGDRSRVAIGSWRSVMRIRQVVVHDTGYSPLVRSVRQGDALFGAQLYEGARSYYMRRAQSGETDTLETLELYYKVAMCLVRQRDFREATNWFNKVAHRSAKGFWQQRARLGLLESEYLQGNIATFFERSRVLFADPDLQSGVRDLLGKASKAWEEQGFLERSLAVHRHLLQLERPHTLPALLGQARLAGTLYLLGRLELAEREFRETSGSKLLGTDAAEQTMLQLSFVQALQGRFPDSEETLADLRARTKNNSWLALCQIHHAYNLRAQGKFTGAVDQLGRVRTAYPGEVSMGVFADIHRAFLLCQLQQPSSARDVLRQAEERDPGHPYFQKGNRSLQYYVPEFISGEFETAGELLLADSRAYAAPRANFAEMAVKAGIMFELAGETNRARKVWSNTARRFPAQSCQYYGSLASSLLHDTPADIESMPYHPQMRSEMFHLTGRLYQARMEQPRATQLFNLSHTEDPTLKWPAYLSKLELSAKA